jgi:hypothetical protein
MNVGNQMALATAQGQAIGNAIRARRAETAHAGAAAVAVAMINQRKQANDKYDALNKKYKDLVKVQGENDHKFVPVEAKLWGFFPALLVPEEGEHSSWSQRRDIMLSIAQYGVNEKFKLLAENDKLRSFIEASGLNFDEIQFNSDEISERKISYLLSLSDVSEYQKRFVDKAVKFESATIESREIMRVSIERKNKILEELNSLIEDKDEKLKVYEAFKAPIDVKINPLKSELKLVTKQYDTVSKTVLSNSFVVGCKLKMRGLLGKTDLVKDVDGKKNVVMQSFSKRKLAKARLKACNDNYELEEKKYEALLARKKSLSIQIDALEKDSKPLLTDLTKSTNLLNSTTEELEKLDAIIEKHTVVASRELMHGSLERKSKILEDLTLLIKDKDEKVKAYEAVKAPIDLKVTPLKSELKLVTEQHDAISKTILLSALVVGSKLKMRGLLGKTDLVKDIDGKKSVVIESFSKRKLAKARLKACNDNYELEEKEREDLLARKKDLNIKIDALEKDSKPLHAELTKSRNLLSAANEEIAKLDALIERCQGSN